MLKKTFVLVLTLTIVYFAESSPLNVGGLEFENIDTDYPDMAFENDESIWDPKYFLKIADEVTREPTKAAKATKDSVKASGSKKKNKLKKGVHGTQNSADLNKFFKNADAYDHGEYTYSDEFAKAAAKAAAAGVKKDKETRTYARGNRTTGFHRVHHKDEYKKDQEFYENDETKGTVNKAVAKVLGTTVNAGKGFKKGSFKQDRHKGIQGKRGHLDSQLVENQFSDYANSADSAGEFSNELDVNI